MASDMANNTGALKDLETSLENARKTKKNIDEVIARLSELNIEVERVLKHESFKSNPQHVCDGECRRRH